VIIGTNLSRQGMIDKVSELTALHEPGDTAALFYEESLPLPDRRAGSAR
jgi:hypothetical protein